jgi:hypothetical protein
MQFAGKKADKLSQNTERNSKKISIFNSLIVVLDYIVGKPIYKRKILAKKVT